MIQRAILSLAFSAVLVTPVLVGPALAHEGVKNPAVMARMESMKAIGAASKSLGQMQKGRVAFDAAAAAKALEVLATEAAAVEALFAAEETDPKSEALPNIWTEHAAFLALADELEAMAKAASVSGPEDLAPLMEQISQNCRSCHKRFRE